MKKTTEKVLLGILSAILCAMTTMVCCFGFSNSDSIEKPVNSDISNVETSYIEIKAEENKESDGKETLKREESDSDELRREKAAEIMGEVFSEEIYEQWDSLSLKVKKDLLNKYYICAGDELGIETEGVIVEDLPDETLGYNSGDGFIHIDIETLEEDESLPGLLDTVSHEMRHQMQFDAICNPELFPDLKHEVLERWAYEWNPDNYINGEYDFEGYYYQAIEIDARYFGESVVEKYMDNLPGETDFYDDETSTKEYELFFEYDFEDLYEEFYDEIYEAIFG